MSRINLLDEPSLLVKKIKSAKTDSGEGLEWDDPNRPEARNLISMYTLATGMSLVRFHQLILLYNSLFAKCTVLS
jgi:tryptophanyl-tRNA synthetase